LRRKTDTRIGGRNSRVQLLPDQNRFGRRFSGGARPFVHVESLLPNQRRLFLAADFSFLPFRRFKTFFFVVAGRIS
jgi:hypothetical protein